jgi:hypothetical protein
MTAAASEGEKVSAPVSLHGLIDAVEAQCDTVSCYLDRITGAIYTVSEEAFGLADHEPAECDMVPEWQRDEVEWARKISASDRYLALPTAWDVHEWAIMEKFCSVIPDSRVASQLLTAIRGRGAFQRFKRQLARHGLSESWNQFRRSAIGNRVIEWCEEHAVRFVA